MDACSGGDVPAGSGRAANADAIFADGGALGVRLRAIDWTTHPIGPPERWPESLLGAVRLLLSSSAPIALFWGREFYAFYNDAYAPVVGDKHPGLLAQPARQHYPELWDLLEPLLHRVIDSGKSFWARDHAFPLNRHGYLEETYFDVSFDPVRVADGTVRGVLCIVSETTGRVVGERRMHALGELAGRLADAPDDHALVSGTVGVLAGYPHDLPFCELLLPDGDAAGQGWTDAGRDVVERVLADGTVRLAPARYFLAEPPATAAPEAVVLPITVGTRTVGVLVAGVSRRRRLDGDYRDFLDLLATQVSRAVSRLRAVEHERAEAAALRALTDSAIAVATASSTAEVARVAARHARELAGASRVAVTIDEGRWESGDPARAGPVPPLTVRLAGIAGAPLGRIDVWWSGARGPVQREGALTQLARLVALRLENTQLYEVEHRIASTLQHSLLPQSLPRIPGAVLACRYLAGSGEVDVGGDWYDAVPLPGGELALVIGDVVGKGVRAAATMGQVRNAFRAYLMEDFPPVEAIARLNRLLISLGQQYFATLACARFDPRTGRLRFASAGHLPPVVISPDGGVAFLHHSALGPPVGALPDASFNGCELHLPPGTRLLLYTDGLVEDRETGIDSGLRLLAEDVAHRADHVEEVLDGVLAKAVGRVRHDDIAVLALEAVEVDRLTLRLPASPDRLTVLRSRLENFLSAHGVADADLFDLIIAVSEAAANAIEHPVRPAESTIHVIAEIHDDQVDVTVRDTGSWRTQSPSAVRGRGLDLIGALADVDLQRETDGTSLVMHRRLTHPRSAPR